MARFGVIITENLRPRWNVAPSQNATVIIRDGLQTAAISAEWGLRPAGGNKSMLINARMETANEKPTFSVLFCIPVASLWRVVGMNGQPQKHHGIFSFAMAR